MRTAVERGVPLIEKSARAYPTHRKCFACHHQTLPLLAVTAARRAGAKVDESLPAALVEFTVTSFRGKLEEMKSGEGIGGRGLTVGYGLWTMQLAQAKPDDMTDAMVTFLLKTQEADGHWGLHAIRPPMEESLVMCTVLAAYGLEQFARDDQKAPAAAAVDKAKSWLAAATLESHEDRLARLWGLHLLGGSAEELAAAREKMLAAQRPDGGWGQTDEMPSDAYATGTALYVLLDLAASTGNAPVSGPPGADVTNAVAILAKSIDRAVDYLLKIQEPDGSWHVKTRAKPVQVFFDNGDPYEKDQFISMSATAWSTAALARSLPVKP